MYRREKRREVAAFSHCEGDARRVQHVRAQVAKHGNQRTYCDESHANRPKELASRVHRGFCRGARICQRVNHNDLHANVEQSGRHDGDLERNRRIFPGIARLARSEEGRLESTVRINHEQDGLKAIRRR